MSCYGTVPVSQALEQNNACFSISYTPQNHSPTYMPTTVGYEWTGVVYVVF
jgi:hypothetical protein